MEILKNLIKNIKYYAGYSVEEKYANETVEPQQAQPENNEPKEAPSSEVHAENNTAAEPQKEEVSSADLEENNSEAAMEDYTYLASSEEQVEDAYYSIPDYALVGDVDSLSDYE